MLNAYPSILHYITSYCVILYNTLYYIHIHYTISYHIMLYYITLHYIILYCHQCVQLYYITLHYIMYIHNIILCYPRLLSGAAAVARPIREDPAAAYNIPYYTML